MEKYLTENQVLEKLRSMALARKGSGGARALAKEIGFSAPYICDLLAGRRAVSVEVAEKLGFERMPPMFRERVSPRIGLEAAYDQPHTD